MKVGKMVLQVAEHFETLVTHLAKVWLVPLDLSSAGVMVPGEPSRWKGLLTNTTI